MRSIHTAVAIALALVASVTVAGTAASAATSDSDCPYPYVCLYKWDDTGWHRTGQLRQFTPGWQYLGVSRGATHLVNTRRDDVVYVLHLDGVVGCFPPENPTGGDIAPIVAIRIDPSNVCRF